jgi:hypothetical protein
MKLQKYIKDTLHLKKYIMEYLVIRDIDNIMINNITRNLSFNQYDKCDVVINY